MARATIITFACITFALFIGGPALADEITDRATEALRVGDSQAAYDLLAPLESDRAGDPEFDYLLGLAALETGRATEAVFAFERVLAIEPANALARADMARALAALNEIEAARREIETVQEAPDVPVEARATIDRFLAALRARPVGADGKVFAAFIAVGGGFDSNVPAANASLGIDDPNLIGEQGSAFGRFSGGANGRFPVRQDLAVLAAFNSFGRVNATQVTNPLGSNFDLNQFSVNGLVGLEWLRGQNAWSLSVQAEHFKSGTSAFRNLIGGSAQVRRRLTSVSHVTGYLQGARLNYHNQNFRNVNRWTTGASYARVFPGRYSPSGYLGGYGGVESNVASGRDDLAHYFMGFRLGGALRLRQDITASFNVNYEYRSYKDDDQFWAAFTAGFGAPQFIRRHDNRLFIRAAIDYEPAKQWFVTPSYEFNMADSTLPTADFDRHVGMLTIRREFR